jgi:hypothetical protein
MTRVKVDTRRVLRDTSPDNTSSQLGVLLWTTYALRITGQHRQIVLKNGTKISGDTPRWVMEDYIATHWVALYPVRATLVSTLFHKPQHV